MPTDTKICGRCGKEKSKTDFYKNKALPSGCSAICKLCTRSYTKEYNLKHKETNKEYNTLWMRGWRERNPEKYMYTSYKSGAKKRKLSFSLSFEQFINVIKQPCHYCGDQGSLGIDRKNSEIGYEIDNCLPCCAICNYAKLDSSYDDFLNWIKRVYKHRLIG